MKYGFGVDLGGTTVKMGLFTQEGELLDKWEIATDTSEGGKNIYIFDPQITVYNIFFDF